MVLTFQWRSGVKSLVDGSGMDDGIIYTFVMIFGGLKGVGNWGPESSVRSGEVKK